MRQIQVKRNKRRVVSPEKKTFLEHLIELKNRFLVWFVSLILFSGIGFLLYSEIINFLIKPLGKPLYYTSPMGGFEAVFNTSLFFGFLFSLPVFIYQLIAFAFPGLGGKSFSLIIKTVILSSLLAITGIVVCYFLILPPSLKFLSQFGEEKITALISARDYFSFVMKYLTSFAIIFQLPLVMLIVDKIVNFKVGKLLSNFRYIFLASFILSAILTPTPDLVNQAVMASPILILYLLSVAIIFLRSGRKKMG